LLLQIAPLVHAIGRSKADLLPPFTRKKKTDLAPHPIERHHPRPSLPPYRTLPLFLSRLTRQDRAPTVQEEGRDEMVERHSLTSDLFSYRRSTFTHQEDCSPIATLRSANRLPSQYTHRHIATDLVRTISSAASTPSEGLSLQERETSCSHRISPTATSTCTCSVFVVQRSRSSVPPIFETGFIRCRRTCAPPAHVQSHVDSCASVLSSCRR
jgi:hypothetical protein